MVRPSQHGAGQGQAVPQAFALAENCTWVELSSVLSARTRLRPLSAPISTSMGSSRSWRGAIVTLHALAEFFFLGMGRSWIMVKGSESRRVVRHGVSRRVAASE
eukprot:scaffold2829_cov119-Isochrysis_galbana.AAC.2